MDKRLTRIVLVLLLVASVCATSFAVSPKAIVSDLLRKTGLSHSQLEGREDIWYVTYTGLDNLEDLDVYVWARETNYVTIYATVFSVENEPTKSFLWRLLECNDSLLGLKYVIRDDPDEKGSYLVDCQVDLPLDLLNAGVLKTNIENLVNTVDEDYRELTNLL